MDVWKWVKIFFFNFFICLKEEKKEKNCAEKYKRKENFQLFIFIFFIPFKCCKGDQWTHFNVNFYIIGLNKIQRIVNDCLLIGFMIEFIRNDRPLNLWPFKLKVLILLSSTKFLEERILVSLWNCFFLFVVLNFSEKPDWGSSINGICAYLPT